MATTPKAEYVGFTVNNTSRVYALCVRNPNGECHQFRIAIGNRAFLSKRVRYQDAAEICFLKLERELGASGDSLPASQMQITDAELDEYREAHTKKPPQRRTRGKNKS